MSLQIHLSTKILQLYGKTWFLQIKNHFNEEMDLVYMALCKKPPLSHTKASAKMQCYLCWCPFTLFLSLCFMMQWFISDWHTCIRLPSPPNVLKFFCAYVKLGKTWVSWRKKETSESVEKELAKFNTVEAQLDEWGMKTCWLYITEMNTMAIIPFCQFHLLLSQFQLSFLLWHIHTFLSRQSCGQKKFAQAKNSLFS